MKFMSFERDGRISCGIVQDRAVLDLGPTPGTRAPDPMALIAHDLFGEAIVIGDVAAIEVDAIGVLRYPVRNEDGAGA